MGVHATLGSFRRPATKTTQGRGDLYPERVNRRAVAGIAWGLAALVLGVAVVIAVMEFRRGDFGGSTKEVVVNWIEALLIPAFALLGALILSNQPRNPVGWLIMIPAIGGAITEPIALWLSSFETAPSSAGAGLLLAIWMDNWSWLLFIFPILHLLQVFPTGRILTPRWRWLAYLEAAMFMFFIGVVSFADQLGPTSVDWRMQNPIGFLSDSFWDGFGPIWTVALLGLVVGGIVSIVRRYRRAQAVERQQLKWLLYNFCLFAVVYSLTGLFQDSEAPGSVLNILFLLSILSIPVSITIAVLRYRLFDIDLIIRRTLIYGLLTGFLGLVYLGSVVLLQSVFGGEGASSLTVAASTLLTTALFAPFRRWIQTVIDRRLFRSKYQAHKVIERFGGSAQNQADLDQLTADLLSVVQETVQPRFGDVWIRKPA